MPSPSLLYSMTALAFVVLICGCSRETTEDTNQGSRRITQSDMSADTNVGVPSNGTIAQDSVTAAQDSGTAVVAQEWDASSSPTSSALPSQDFRTELDATNSDPEKLQENAIIALDSGDVGEAFELVRDLKRLDGKNPQTIFLMARVLAEKHRFRQAVKMLDELAIEFPDAKLPVLGQTAEWLVFQGDWQAAESRYLTLISLVDETSLVDRLLSRLLMREGRRVEAKVLLRRLCRAGNVEEMDLRSLLSLACPLPGDAVTDAFEPIGLEGTVRHAISKGEVAAAGEMLQRALDETPASVTSAEYALRGRLLVLLEQFDRLPEWIKSAPDGSEEYSDYWFAIGVDQLQRSDFSAAVDSLGRAVIRDETDSRAYRVLGDALLGLGKPEQAQVATERAGLIEQTVSLGDQMASNQQRDVGQISVLIDLLERLQRPLEALGWRGIQVAYGRANSMLDDAQARDVLKMINQNRIAQLEKSDPAAKRLFVICGIDLLPESN